MQLLMSVNTCAVVPVFQVTVLDEGDITSSEAQEFFAKLDAGDLAELEILPSKLPETIEILFSPPVLYKVVYKVHHTDTLPSCGSGGIVVPVQDLRQLVV